MSNHLRGRSLTAPTSGLTPSLVRTMVPFLVGLLGSWATRQGLDINDDWLAAALTFVFGYGYYVVVRFLEVFASSKWGYILGLATGPAYFDELQDGAGGEVVVPGGGVAAPDGL